MEMEREQLEQQVTQRAAEDKLREAAKLNKLDIIRLLLICKINPNARDEVKFCFTHI